MRHFYRKEDEVSKAFPKVDVGTLDQKEEVLSLQSDASDHCTAQPCFCRTCLLEDDLQSRLISLRTDRILRRRGQEARIAHGEDTEEGAFLDFLELIETSEQPPVLAMRENELARRRRLLGYQARTYQTYGRKARLPSPLRFLLSRWHILTATLVSLWLILIGINPDTYQPCGARIMKLWALRNGGDAQ